MRSDNHWGISVESSAYQPTLHSFCNNRRSGVNQRSCRGWGVQSSTYRQLAIAGLAFVMAFQTDIRSTETFKSEVLDTSGVLQVVECYNEWAGPCKAIQSTLKTLYFSISDRPLKFYTVNVDKVHGFEQHRGKSQPAFLLYKDGLVKETITGVQGPTLMQAIMALSAKAAS